MSHYTAQEDLVKAILLALGSPPDCRSVSHYTAHDNLVKAILLAVGSRPDCRVWRQEVGLYRVGPSLTLVKIGVPGMADIGGIYRGGRVLQIEVKTGRSRLSHQQIRWRDMILGFGGIYVEARSVDDAVKALPSP